MAQRLARLVYTNIRIESPIFSQPDPFGQITAYQYYLQLFALTHADPIGPMFLRQYRSVLEASWQGRTEHRVRWLFSYPPALQRLSASAEVVIRKPLPMTFYTNSRARGLITMSNHHLAILDHFATWVPALRLTAVGDPTAPTALSRQSDHGIHVASNYPTAGPGSIAIGEKAQLQPCRFDYARGFCRLPPKKRALLAIAL